MIRAASILVAVIGTLLMALYAKMPFAQACGMGLNSFFFVSFILPALVSGGVLMLKGFSKVDMDDVRSAVPAFLALITM